MKVIYKLPKYLALIVFFVAGYIVISDVKSTQNASFFDLVEQSNNAGVRDISILGIDAYVFLMMVGLLFTIVLAVLRRHLLEIKSVTAVIIAVVFFLQAYLGAKILYGLELVISENDFGMFDMEGQSLYGTVFISFLFIPILAKLLRKNINSMFDYIAPFWIVLLAFVRLGCFTIGCCGADACMISGVSIILPVQLFEVICDLIIMQIVFCFENKANEKCEKFIKTGDSFFIMIGLYGLCRFLLEFIRATEVIFAGFTFGQIYSIICIFISIIVICLNKKKCR